MTSIPLTGVTATVRAGSLLVWTVTPPSPVPSGGWSVAPSAPAGGWSAVPAAPNGGWSTVAAGPAGDWSAVAVPETFFLVVPGDEERSLEVLAPEGGETSTQFMVYSAGDNWTPVAT